LDQKEEEIKVASEEKRKKQAAVPGVLNPHELPEDTMDG
jgi:exportin-1